MKKLYLALVPTLLLAACSNTNKPLTKEALVGEWVCSTEYKDVNVGTVDFITLNADSSLKDDNYIFDHILGTMFDEKIKNYFQSPLRYLKVNEGTWRLSGNTLTYSLKQKNFNRLIFPDVWERIQKVEKFKKIEEKTFKVLSSNKADEIELVFNKFIKNGFILNQNINGKNYQSQCLKKEVSKYSYLEAYKERFKVE